MVSVHNWCSYFSILRDLLAVRQKVELSLYLSKHCSMKACWGSGCIGPCFLDLGTSWWVVSFKHRPLYTCVKSLWYTFDWSLSGRYGEEWTFVTLPEVGLRTLDHPARNQSLYRRCYRGKLTVTDLNVFHGAGVFCTSNWYGVLLRKTYPNVYIV
jgi:hypothetical protein